MQLYLGIIFCSTLPFMTESDDSPKRSRGRPIVAAPARRVLVNARVPAQLHATVTELAGARGISFTAAVEAALTDWAARQASNFESREKSYLRTAQGPHTL